MMETKEVAITDSIRVGGRHNKLLVIAGPCQIESLEHSLMVACTLKERLQDLPVHLVFKASFDKANRTSGASPRGPGMEAGLRVLQEVRKRTGLPVLTDVHTEAQIGPVAETVDVVQTPAFLCRQTDFLTAVGNAQKPVNVKKGQFLHPSDMHFAAQKIVATGNDRILLCERGTCFGYRDLVVDPRSIIMMQRLGYPVILDATHAVQSLGGGASGGASGGQREFVAPLARAGAALGVDGIFLECHENPDRAPSDGPSMLKLSEVASVIRSVCAIREAFLLAGQR
jgi:2-dehydro-3-deoxyphosphooctonate aldolase (KDO 8-P synthase)